MEKDSGRDDKKEAKQSNDEEINDPNYKHQADFEEEDEEISGED
jgi:protein-tyrosine-phosphatase